MAGANGGRPSCAHLPCLGCKEKPRYKIPSNGRTLSYCKACHSERSSITQRKATEKKKS